VYMYSIEDKDLVIINLALSANLLKGLYILPMSRIFLVDSNLRNDGVFSWMWEGW